MFPERRVPPRGGAARQLRLEERVSHPRVAPAGAQEPVARAQRRLGEDVALPVEDQLDEYAREPVPTTGSIATTIDSRTSSCPS